MRQQDGANAKARECQTVTDSLQERTRRSKSRRCDIRSSKVVDDNSDRDVDGRDDRLADDQCTGTQSWIPHLGGDREEAWCAGKGEDE